jgi:hypothetical protein
MILWRRYWFGQLTIFEATEDSQLFPPELLHDAERRCDKARRQENIALQQEQQSLLERTICAEIDPGTSMMAATSLV